MRHKAALVAALQAETSPMATGMAVVQVEAQEVQQGLPGKHVEVKVPDETSCPAVPEEVHFPMGSAAQVPQACRREEHEALSWKMVNPEQATAVVVVVAQVDEMMLRRARVQQAAVAWSGSNGPGSHD
jgi:hypothetical protein